MTRAQDSSAAPGAVRPSGPKTVVVHGSDVHVERAHFELPLAEARSRYGGASAPGVVAGALAGLGTASLLGGLDSAAGLQVGQSVVEGTSVPEFAVGGAVAAVVVLALSALAAGWVAGRVARFDGARNGLLAGLLGGRLGARWHRDVDDVPLGTRPGAVGRALTTEVTR